MSWWEIALLVYFGCELIVLVDWCIFAATTKKVTMKGLKKVVMTSLICPPVVALVILCNWITDLSDWLWDAIKDTYEDEDF